MGKEKDIPREGARGFHRDVRLLLTAAFIRSAAQGIALVDMSLYLRSLGWNGGEIGGVLAAAGIVRTVLVLFAGRLNAKLGAKRYLLLFEILTAASAAVAAMAAQPAAIAAAMIAAGLGSGHSGSGGPAAPIERAWLAAHARRGSKPLVSIHARIGWFGMGAGAWLACLASLWGGEHPGPEGYRPVLLVLALLSAGCAVVLLRAKGGKRKPAAEQGRPANGLAAGQVREQTANGLSAGHEAKHADGEPSSSSGAGRRAWLSAICCAVAVGLAFLLRQAGLKPLSLYVPIAVFIAIVAFPFLRQLLKRKSPKHDGRSLEELKQLAHMLGIVSATLTSTMTSYWFSAKFHVSPLWIGAIMGLSYMAAGGLTMLFENGSDRQGRVKAIIAMQQVSIVLLLILPWATSFRLAAAVEIACTACSLGTRGSRMEIRMEERGQGHRSLFSKIYYLIIRIGAVLWPGSFGRLVDEGQYVVPFYIAAALQAGSAYVYAKLNRAAAPDHKRTD